MEVDMETRGTWGSYRDYLQGAPTLGPKACKYCLLSAMEPQGEA